MKRLLVTLCIFCFATTKVPAQDINKNFCRQFGIKLGMNCSTIHYTNVLQNNVPQTSWIPGLVAGAFFTLPVAGKLSFQSEYLLSSLGSKLEGDSVFRLNYLSMPVLLKLNVANKFSILGGGNFDLLLQAKEKGKSTHESIKGLETRNIGLTGGLEYQATEAIELQARYMNSMNHIDDIYKEREFKNRSIQLTAAFKW